MLDFTLVYILSIGDPVHLLHIYFFLKLDSIVDPISNLTYINSISSIFCLWKY
jgi:hypothetical protein